MERYNGRRIPRSGTSLARVLTIQRYGVWAVVCFVSFFAISSFCLAADRAQQAQVHNAMGKKLFSLGMFKEAAKEYHQAYQAKPIPAFLYNLAQCYKRMTEPDSLKQAVFYFRSYLKNEPSSPVKKQIKNEIAKLERRIRALSKRPFYKRWWFWTAIGVLAAGATVGTIVALQPKDHDPVRGTVNTFQLP